MTTGDRAMLVCAGLLAAFLAGYYSRTPQTEIVQERAQEEARATEHLEASTSVVAHVEAAKAEATQVQAQEERVRIVWRVREEKPDGSRHEQVLELDAASAQLLAQAQASQTTAAQVQAQEVRAEARAAEAFRATERLVKIEAPQPDWRIGGLVGFDLRGPGFTYGVEVQRRILGPIYLGAGALSSGSVFASTGVEW
jgi:hypothetical protein